MLHLRRRGQGLAEWSVGLALVAVVAIVSLSMVSSTMDGVFSSVHHALEGAIGLAPDSTPGPSGVSASFVAQNPTTDTDTPVIFVNNSSGATAWEWDFHDGSPHDFRQSPTHRYVTPGSYAVNLTVSGPDGTNSLTRPAYISVTAAVPTYGTNVLVGGTAFASSDRGDPRYFAANATDGNESTRWASNDGQFPNWWAYDLGAGTTRTVQKVGFVLNSSETTNSFTIDGSADGTSWRTLYLGNGANTSAWQYFTFDNAFAYRYYRIFIYDVWSGAVGSISEIEMYERTDTLGPGLTPLIPSAVTVSSDRGAPYAVANSWDGDLTTRWATPDSITAGWWQADLGAPAVLTRLQFVLLSNETVRDFVLEGSNDGSTWTGLLTAVGANAQRWQSFEVDNSTAYRYYRLSVSDVWAGVVVSLSEVQLWGP